MKLKSYLLTLACLFCLFINAKAQSIPGAEEVHFYKEFTNSHTIPEAVLDTLTNPMGLLTPNDTLIYSVSFRVPDTVNVQSVRVKFSTTQGGSNLVNQSYLLNGVNSLTYFRQADQVTIALGRYRNNNVYFCEVVLAGVLTNQSDAVTIRSDQ